MKTKKVTKYCVVVEGFSENLFRHIYVSIHDTREEAIDRLKDSNHFILEQERIYLDNE